MKFRDADEISNSFESPFIVSKKW